MTVETLFQSDENLGKRVSFFWDGLGLERRGSGIFRYGEEIARGFVAAGVTPVIVSPPGSEDLSGLKRLVIADSIFGRKLSRAKFIWAHRAFAALKKVNAPKGAIFHAHSNINLSLSPACHEHFNTVLTIHDIIPLLAPESVSKAATIQMNYFLPRLLPQVKRVLTGSEWTKAKLLERYPFIADKLEVIPYGFSAVANPSRRPTSGPLTILTISRFEPYKRVDFIPAILKAAREMRALIVTDSVGKTWFEENAADLMRQGRLEILTGLSEDKLAQLWERTHVYVHPSLYEGYGLPMAEALAQHVPFVFAQGSGAAEGTGPHVAKGLSAQSPASAWVEAIETLAAKAATPAFQTDLQNEIASRPSWNSAARKILKVYDNLLNNQ